MPTEVTHYNIQPTIEVTLGVYGRDLGHVSDDVSKVLSTFGALESPGKWSPYDPNNQKEKVLLPGSTIQLSGEYLRMKETFNSLFSGLGLAALLIYFLMVGLDKSFVVPLSVISIVPLCLIGILPTLYFTRLGGERAVAAGLHLHRRDQGGQLGADDRLCPGAAAA